MVAPRQDKVIQADTNLVMVRVMVLQVAFLIQVVKTIRSKLSDLAKRRRTATRVLCLLLERVVLSLED